MTTKKVAAIYSPKVRERAVRLVSEGGGDHLMQGGLNRSSKHWQVG